MSKAFTKEQDGEENGPEVELTRAKLPTGTKNYMTPSGVEKLRSELRDLLDRVRPEVTKVVAWAASLGDRSENADYIYGKKRLREIDRKIHFLTKRLEAAEVVDPTQIRSDQVRFGATVTVRGEDGEDRVYSIVGIDETNIKKGWISWVSPLGRALLKNRVGDTIHFTSPKGEEDLEIVQIRYVPIG